MNENKTSAKKQGTGLMFAIISVSIIFFVFLIAWLFEDRFPYVHFNSPLSAWLPMCSMICASFAAFVLALLAVIYAIKSLRRDGRNTKAIVALCISGLPVLFAAVGSIATIVYTMVLNI